MEININSSFLVDKSLTNTFFTLGFESRRNKKFALDKLAF